MSLQQKDLPSNGRQVMRDKKKVIEQSAIEMLRSDFRNARVATMYNLVMKLA